MTGRLLMLMLVTVSGGEPDLQTRFRALQSAKDAKYLQVSGAQLDCLNVATADFKVQLGEDPQLARYGSKLNDFDAVVIEKDGRCVVAFGARGKRMGGGVEYWVEGERLMKKGYSK